ncbi:hypothetical protein ES703_113695 [subsurface metagenome]
MDNENYILIIIRDTGLSREEIRKMIDRKKKERKDSSSDRIALLNLAKDLCVEFSK